MIICCCTMHMSAARGTGLCAKTAAKRAFKKSRFGRPSFLERRSAKPAFLERPLGYPLDGQVHPLGEVAQFCLNPCIKQQLLSICTYKLYMQQRCIDPKPSDTHAENSCCHVVGDSMVQHRSKATCHCKTVREAACKGIYLGIKR